MTIRRAVDGDGRWPSINGGDQTMVTHTAIGEFGSAGTCWCCGAVLHLGHVVSLGNHPEVELCLPCAHALHRQANAREDALHPSRATRIRDRMRAARNTVIHRQWHQKPIIGRPLRWLGRHTP
jgi:hypothetical protein